MGPRKDIPVAQGTVPLQLPPVRFIHFKDKNGHCARLIASHRVLPASPLGPCMYVSAASAWVLSPLAQPLSHGLSSLLTNPHAVDILSKEQPLESQSQTCPEMSHADVSYLPSSTIHAKSSLPALPCTSPSLTSPAQESPSSLHSPRPSQPLDPLLVHEAGPAAAVFCFPALWTPQPSCVTSSGALRCPRLHAGLVLLLSLSGRAGLADTPCVHHPYVASGLGRVPLFIQHSAVAGLPTRFSFPRMPILPAVGDADEGEEAWPESRRVPDPEGLGVLLLLGSQRCVTLKNSHLQWESRGGSA